MKRERSFTLLLILLSIVIFILIGCNAHNQQEDISSQTDQPIERSTETPLETTNNENIIQAPTLYSQLIPNVFILKEDGIIWEMLFTDKDGNQTPYSRDMYKINNKNFHYLTGGSELELGKLIDYAYSPQMKTFILYTHTNMYEFDRDTLDFSRSWQVKPQRMNTIAMSPDGTIFAYSVDDEIHIDSINFVGMKSPPFLTLNPGFTTTNIVFSPDGTKIIVRSESNEEDYSQTINYTIYDLQGNVIFSKSYLDHYNFSFFYITEDNKAIFVITYMENYSIPEYPYDVYVVDLQSGLLTMSYTNQIMDYYGQTKSTLTGNQSELPTEEQIRFWLEETRPNSLLERNMYNGHCYPGNLPDNPFYDFDYFIEVTYDDKTAVFLQYHLDEAVNLQLVDLSTCEVIAVEHFYPLYGILFSPDDRYTAFTDGFNTFIWDNILSYNGGGFIPGSIDTQPQNIYVFNADSTRFISSMEALYEYGKPKAYQKYTLDILDLETMETFMIIRPSGNYLRSLHATADPDIILVFDSDGLDIWNINNGELIKHFETQLYDFDIASNQLWLVLSETDHNFRIVQIDIQTGDILHEIETLNTEVKGMQLFDQGKTLEIIVQSTEPSQQTSISLLLDTSSGKTLDPKFLADTWNLIDARGCCDYLAETKPGARMDTSKYFPGDFVQETNLNVITHKENSYYIWDKSSNEFVGQIDFGFQPKEVAISPNALFIAALDEGGQFYFFQIHLQ